MDEAGRASFCKSLEYMGFAPQERLLGHPVDYVFVGSCTNGRIEDFRAFAQIVKGRRKADGITAWIVPGSWSVQRQIVAEGIDKILHEAGFELRQPGCSACLAMNEDKVPAGKYCISTSNRNFEGRQGPGARTILASPYVAAAAAVRWLPPSWRCWNCAAAALSAWQAAWETAPSPAQVKWAMIGKKKFEVHYGYTGNARS